MSRNELYTILGVSPSAGEKEIRAAYRRLAKKYHPDAGEGSSDEKFRAVQDAYDVLGDCDRRRKYDRSQIPVNAWAPHGNLNRNYGPADWTVIPRTSEPGHIELRIFRFGTPSQINYDRGNARRSAIDDAWLELLEFLFGR